MRDDCTAPFDMATQPLIQSNTQDDDSFNERLNSRRLFRRLNIFGFFSLLKIGRIAEQLSLHANNANRIKLHQVRFCLHCKWWRMTGSNRRPPACKAGALPTELIPQLVGLVGLEPTTPALSTQCSNQLSYKPSQLLSTESLRSSCP